MDLMGEIGLVDQLTSYREENKVLNRMIKELQSHVKELTVDNHALRIENAGLQAEVEEYRREAALPSFSRLSVAEESKISCPRPIALEDDHFVKSGNGVFPTEAAATLKELHGQANPLCCSLHPDDSLLVTGGADAQLALCRWGTALAPGENAASQTVEKSARIKCPAPIISVSFSTMQKGKALPLVAAGCMDGSVNLIKYSATELQNLDCSQPIRHAKYVKCLAWSPTRPILATASADGTVQITQIVMDSELGSMSMDMDDETKTADPQKVGLETLSTLHLPGPVEAMTFLPDGSTLVCHARGTSYLSYFDLNDDCKHTKHSVNGDITGGYDEHVSFTVMALVPHGKYLAAATDSSRNIIFEAHSSRQIRNLYGHQNDAYSQPKIAWSSSGQYLLGNTQVDGSVCVWDIASTKLIRQLNDHQGTVRDLFSSPHSDTLVTVSYDKSAKVWLNAM